ncbi:MAG: YafY family protein [Pseudomonadota bacterium]
MKKTERLFHLVERLRSSSRPMTAIDLGQELEVSERTIYRDMKLLMLQGLPITGEAGMGYIISPDFNAPALQFTRDELEILAIGLRMVFRDGDNPMQRASETAFSKIKNGLKGTGDLDSIDLYAPSGTDALDRPYLTKTRLAIRNRSVIEVEYLALSGESTQRRLKPLALLFFPEATLVAGFCELRQDFRNFRVDRFKSLNVTSEKFKSEHYRLRRAYMEMVRNEREHRH